MSASLASIGIHKMHSHAASQQSRSSRPQTLGRNDAQQWERRGALSNSLSASSRHTFRASGGASSRALPKAGAVGPLVPRSHPDPLVNKKLWAMFSSIDESADGVLQDEEILSFMLSRLPLRAGASLCDLGRRQL